MNIDIIRNVAMAKTASKYPLLSPDEQTDMDNETKIITTATGMTLGTAIGLIVGGLYGATRDKDRVKGAIRSALKGGVVGAAVGGAGGYASSNSISDILKTDRNNNRDAINRASVFWKPFPSYETDKP